MYAELQAQSNYSFLEGASHPEELIERSIELGLKALALTDKNGVYGIPKAYWKAKDFPQFRLITGCQLSIDEHPPITLLAKKRKGYGLMCRIISKAFEGKEKGKASLQLLELSTLLQDAASEELFCLLEEDSQFSFFKEHFDREQLSITLNRFLDGHDKRRTHKALELSRAWDIDLVATNKVCLHELGRKTLHDVLSSIKEGVSLDRLGYKLQPNAERHLKGPLEMRRLFSDLPQTLERSLEIADECLFSPCELRYRYPDEWIPEGESAQSFLERCTWAGARKRYPKGIPLNTNRQIVHELRLVEQLRYADYFLTIYDIVKFAQEKDILCQGRGSAANSVICYCLGITAIDPVQMNLLFERFISAERGEPPDIDVDFEHERREEVIQYIYEKYGRHKAAMVCTMITYRSRSALRDVAKAFQVDVGTLSARKVEKNFSELAKNSGIENCEEKVLDVVQELKGFPRHPGIHSGGFVLSADPLIETVPIEPARMEGRTVIQWDKYDLDYLGLMKIDVLSLGMLTALKKALDSRGMKLHEIPHDDPKTYQMIQRADTVGTFQIESRAQMSMLGRLQPKNFYDLVVEVAIVRPGPIVGQMVHPYLKRRRGLEKIHYYHPKLKKILGKTLGVPLFQEQVMKMAIEIAGFTPGQADELRRSISAWRSQGSVNKMAMQLFAGLKKEGIPEEFCERIYKQIFGFSKYGFPESHAASFALLAYASCYIKCHFPADFTCALLNSQPMGFYASHTLVDDAKRHGVEIRALHPNRSRWDSFVESGSIQLGWHIVKGLGEEDAQKLLKAQPFESVKDFVERSGLRKDLLYRLALAGAFDCWKSDRRHSLWELLRELPERQQSFRLGTKFPVQESLFKDFDEVEKTALDYEGYRLSTRGHPMEFLRKKHKFQALTTRQTKNKRHGQWVKSAGLNLVLQKPSTAKGVAFSTLEDEWGFLDLVIHPDVFDRYKETYINDAFLLVEGVFQKDAHTSNLVVKKMHPLLPPNTHLPIEANRFFH